MDWRAAGSPIRSHATSSARAKATARSQARDGDGNLKVISWEVPPPPQEIVRLDDENAGVVSRIAASVCGVAPPGTLTFQTSVCDGGGDLKIITWRSPLGGNPITRFPPGSASAGTVSLISTACFN